MLCECTIYSLDGEHPTEGYRHDSRTNDGTCGEAHAGQEHQNIGLPMRGIEGCRVRRDDTNDLKMSMSDPRFCNIHGYIRSIYRQFLCH